MVVPESVDALHGILGSIPDNAFQKNIAGREWQLNNRVASVIVGGLKLAGVGFISIIGVVASVNILNGIRRLLNPALAVEETNRRSPLLKTAVVYGSFLGTSANIRYQGHTLKMETDSEEELKEAFKVFDKDQNGFISAAEVNVAHAHICAEKALSSGGEIAERAAGQAYFITNMEPMKFWEFVAVILDGLGYERPSIKIPTLVMKPIAQLVALAYKVLGPYGMPVPQLTPSRISLLTCNRTFNCSKAKDRIFYTPIVPLQEGLKRTIDSYSNLRANLTKREGPSKSYLLLGSGKAADILLWRDQKQTIKTLIVLIAFYCYFIATEYTIITAVSKLLMVTTFFLFVHGFLPSKLFGYSIEKLPSSSFHFSEERFHWNALFVRSIWNSIANTLQSLCKGKDWTLFVKVFSSLLFLSFLGSKSIQCIYSVGVVFAFTAFFVYEKKEDEIDGLVHKALSFGCKVKSS